MAPNCCTATRYFVGMHFSVAHSLGLTFPGPGCNSRKGSKGNGRQDTVICLNFGVCQGEHILRVFHFLFVCCFLCAFKLGTSSWLMLPPSCTLSISLPFFILSFLPVFSILISVSLSYQHYFFTTTRRLLDRKNSTYLIPRHPPWHYRKRASDNSFLYQWLSSFLS